MKNKFFVLVIIIFSTFSTYSQIKTEGKITYISSQNIYVQFDVKLKISEGDTLFLESNNKLEPALIVKFISSKSIAGEKITNKEMQVGTILIYFEKKIENSISEARDTLITKEVQKNEIIQQEFRKREIKKLNGRVTLQSMNDFSNIDNSNDIIRYRNSFSIQYDDVKENSFSARTYFILNYKSNDESVLNKYFGKTIKVYDLRFDYYFNNDNQLTIGRFIENNMSGLGVTDGVSFKKSFINNKVGVIIGSRPHLTDFGFNSKLFQAGIFYSRIDSFDNKSIENSISIFNQTNSFKTDRRFIYFQHQNYLIMNTMIFLSLESDFYSKLNGKEKNDFSLTGLFFRVSNRSIKQLNMSLSFDSRRNVYLFETYKTFIDSIFSNELRQGLRFNANYRITNNFSLSYNTSYRYRKGDKNPSLSNVVGLAYYNIPIVTVDLISSYTKLKTNFNSGEQISITLQKDIFEGLVNSSISFRNSKYTFNYINRSLTQNQFLIDLNYLFLSAINMNFSYEGTFENKNSFGRLFFDLTYRF